MYTFKNPNISRQHFSAVIFDSIFISISLKKWCGTNWLPSFFLYQKEKHEHTRKYTQISRKQIQNQNRRKNYAQCACSIYQRLIMRPAEKKFMACPSSKALSKHSFSSWYKKKHWIDLNFYVTFSVCRWYCQFAS